MGGGDGDEGKILSKYIWNERESGGCEFVNCESESDESVNFRRDDEQNSWLLLMFLKYPIDY